MYQVLVCDPLVDDEGGTFEVDDKIDSGVDLDSWSSGLLIDVEKPGPYELSMRAVRGYEGPPADYYESRVCLMSERMVEALSKAGVDNIQVFPSFLVETETGNRWPICAVNIVGLVAAAELSASEWTCDQPRPVDEVHFEKLAIDPRATRGLLLFRLAENTTTIIIHEQVARALESASLTGVSFVDPADWVT